MNTVRLLHKEFVTHDVNRYFFEKPKNYKFTPGQATEISINEDGWEEEKRPFTFTNLNEDLILEFIIKSYDTKKYPDHDGVTEKLATLDPGQKIMLDEPWGTIKYKGKGVFIAGGAGITPFIAILRDLQKKNKLKGNKLIFSNKTRKDIILEDEFIEMFPEDDVIFTLTREQRKGYPNVRIDKKFLQKNITDFTQNFYICGPPSMVSSIKKDLADLGAQTDSIVFEK